MSPPLSNHARSFVCLSYSLRYITGETLVVDGGAWLNTGLTPPIPKDMIRKASRAIEAKSRKTGLAAKSKL